MEAETNDDAGEGVLEDVMRKKKRKVVGSKMLKIKMMKMATPSLLLRFHRSPAGLHWSPILRKGALILAFLMGPSVLD